MEPLDVGVGVGVGVGLGEPELEDEGAGAPEGSAGAGVPGLEEPAGAELDAAEPGGAELAADEPQGEDAWAFEPGAEPELEPDCPLPLDAPPETFHEQPFTSRHRLFEVREVHETG